MRDDLAALNIGTADPEYNKDFFWRSYRDIEMFMTRVLSKGPAQVSNLSADEIITDNLTGDVTGNVTGDLTGDVTGDVAGNVTGNVIGNLTGSVTITGSLTPNTTGTINLGSASLRWATVYTSDLDLSNGIGDWTIVEGEDDLFLYNNKRGKTYKFALTEVDPSMAPPKKV